MRVTLESLLNRLIAKGTETTRKSSVNENSAASPTSIRLKPATKHFLECQAAVLNSSVQSLIGMILDGVAEMTTDNTAGALRTIRDRFFYLFQEHKLDLPGIISVMKNHGFTLSALESSGRHLDLLDQKAIHFMADTFFVRPEWLWGSSDYVIEQGSNVRWYKNVYEAGRRLLSYQKAGFQPHVMFIRRAGADFEKAKAEEDRCKSEPIGFAVRLKRCTDDGVSFICYEVWEFERWNYWRCREQIKLLIAFCDQTHSFISFSGYELPDESLTALCSKKVVPSVILDKINQVQWYPEDYASMRFEVTNEVGEWLTVKEQYQKGSYEAMIREAVGSIS